MAYDIDGYLVAQDGDLNISAKFRLADATVEIKKAGSDVAPTTRIPAGHPAVTRHMDLIASELQRIAYRNRPIVSISKPPAKRKRRTPEPVICPDCLGARSYDCETCDGAGKVPG